MSNKVWGHGMVACAAGYRIFLFTAYLLSIVCAMANPANLNYELAYQLTQGANIVTLLLLAYCKRSTGQTLLASLLGLALALRTTDSWKGGSRWDSLLTVLGMFVVMKQTFYLMLPADLPHKLTLYITFSLIILPVVAALPYLVSRPDVDDTHLRRAIQLVTRSYSLPEKDGVTDDGILTIYDGATDTTVGLAADAANDTYVVFPGTTTLKDWKVNVNILPQDVPPDWTCENKNPLRVHRGYLRAFQAVAPRLLAAVRARLGRAGGGRLVLCGHSLGGALATLAAAYFACVMPEVRPYLTVITFGAPQVGDGNFVKFFDRVVPRCARIVNPMDPVPRLLNAQLVHVKGYTPVSSFKLSAVYNAHNDYDNALQLGHFTRTIASFVPAVLAAVAIGLYLAWQHVTAA